MFSNSLLTLFLLHDAWAGVGRIEVSAPDAPGEIVLDSFPTGEIAPATIEDVPPGEHQVELFDNQLVFCFQC